MNANASPKPRRGRQIGLFLAMLAVSGVMALGLAEIALRLFPIPGIQFHSFYYDPVTGGNFYPHSTTMYRGDNGVLLKRHINSWGFPDVDHKMDAPPGTLRIGFFGDSYVDARQVRIQDTFFRLIQDDLSMRTGDLSNLKTRDGHAITDVETIAFGVSGRAALESYLECHRWMKPLDLDYVVYVFVHNDPADGMRQLAHVNTKPYALIEGDSFVVDNSFNEAYGYKTSWWHRAVQRIKSNSLVVSTVEGRLKMLKAYGAKRKVTEADREGGKGGGGTPMALSAWPPDLIDTGWEIQTRVMDRWRREAEAQGRKFIIMNVPRGEEVLSVPLAERDSWASHLQAYCADRGIPLIEPTDIFLEREKTGEKMYHDHFTPEGHRAFADAFERYLIESNKAQ